VTAFPTYFMMRKWLTCCVEETIASQATQASNRLQQAHPTHFTGQRPNHRSL
jgi:hypothetical protein